MNDDVAGSTSPPNVGSMGTSLSDRVRDLEDTVRFLTAAINRYCDNPGCNIPARATALGKLRWSAEEAAKKVS